MLKHVMIAATLIMVKSRIKGVYDFGLLTLELLVPKVLSLKNIALLLENYTKYFDGFSGERWLPFGLLVVKDLLL